jgi:tetratricopeptide (TPR) repeat protein
MILRPPGVSTMLTVEGRKSQIAIEYAYQFREQHPKAHVLWVYAANETRFVQAYRETAQNLRLPGCDDPQVNVCKVVCKWLNDTEDVPWLMVLDNADQTANFLSVEGETTAEISTISTYMASYLPSKFNHSQFLLVTTRIRDIGEHLSRGQPCVNVGPFSAQEARDLLQAKLRALGDCSTPAMDTLVEILGRIPLAITQAAAFINRNKISVQEYVRELDLDKQNFMQYLSKDLQDPRRELGFPNSIFRTWKLSFDQIQTDSPRAAEILSLMAMLDGQKIPVDLVRKDDERRVDFQTVIGTLDGYSMINKEVGGRTCTIHPLVQLSVQYILEESGQTVFYTGQAIQLIADRFPVGEHENKAVCESLLPHAQAVLRLDTKSDATVASRARLLFNVGWFEWRQGRYNSAHQNVLAAHEIWQRISGSETDTIRSLDLLALVLRFRGKYEAAEEMNRRALSGYEKVLGVEHPNTLTSVGSLALALRDQGKYEAAEGMYRRALTGYEKVLGVEHPHTLTSVGGLASVLQGQGKHEAVEEMYRRALTGYEKVLGVEHPHTLTSVGNLASVLQDQGKYEAAEEMYRRALTGREKVLGLEHPRTLNSVFNLAYLHHSQRQFQQASVLYQRALSGYQQILGPAHPTTLACGSNYSSMVREMEKEDWG